MKKFLLAVLCTIPAFANAQWENAVDNIFDCKPWRTREGNFEYFEIIEKEENGELSASFSYLFSGCAGAYKFEKKHSLFSNNRNLYIFDAGANKSLVIFRDDLYYSQTKFYVGEIDDAFPCDENGRYYSSSGKLLYEGRFVADHCEDEPCFESLPSIIKYDSPKKFQYIKMSDGFYLGETNRGIKNGFGLCVYSNGDTWFGEWSDGKRNGQGAMFYSNCKMKVGFWYGDNYSETARK